jgi:ABC-type Mn2+/Zn2+ transport system permease subunit
VTARLLTQSFGRMLVLSTVIGSACGALGMYASYYANVPSGTMIVLIAATGFLIALGLGPALRRREAREPVGPAPVPGVVLSPGA